jgi:hypothetical protein
MIWNYILSLKFNIRTVFVILFFSFSRIPERNGLFYKHYIVICVRQIIVSFVYLCWFLDDLRVESHMSTGVEIESMILPKCSYFSFYHIFKCSLKIKMNLYSVTLNFVCITYTQPYHVFFIEKEKLHRYIQCPISSTIQDFTSNTR